MKSWNWCQILICDLILVNLFLPPLPCFRNDTICAIQSTAQQIVGLPKSRGIDLARAAQGRNIVLCVDEAEKLINIAVQQGSELVVLPRDHQT